MRLATLATHIPNGRISAEEIIHAAGGSKAEARVFRRLFGLDQVASIEAGEDYQDQLERVVGLLADRHNSARPDAIIRVRGLPLRPAGNVSAMQRLRQKFEFLSQIERQYEVDQTNCSGLFWALQKAQILLKAGLARSVLVLAGDSHDALKLRDRYVPGSTLMGDAFCGLILDLGSGGVQIDALTLQVHPEFSFGNNGDVAQMGTFFAAHGRLVRAGLDDLGFSWGGQGAVLPHNVNAMAWHMFCRETDLSPGRVRLNLLPDIGHCYTCDPFLLLDMELRATAGKARLGLVEAQAAMTLISVGMGGFVGGCRLRASAGFLSSQTITNPSRSFSHACSA